MDIHYLKLFNTLASQLNFSKAADLLFISQPAVSMQLKKLENDLGVKLFDKVGKNICLNENGKILYSYTKQIFDIVEKAETHLYSLNNEIKGTVNIGSSNTPGNYVLPRILGEFMGKYPDVSVNLLVANTSEIEHMIFDNKIDFAISGGHIEYGKQIDFEKIASDRLVIIASPKHELARNESVVPEMLGRYPFIGHNNNSQLYIYLQNIFHELSLPLVINMHLGSTEAIKEAVSAKVGLSIIPHSATRNELKYGMLKEIKIPNTAWEYPYYLIFRKNRFISSAALKLMDLSRVRVKEIVEEAV